MADERPDTSSKAILNPRSSGTTAIGSMPPVDPPDGPRRSPLREGGMGERLLVVLTILLTLGAAVYVFSAEEQDALSDPLKRAARGEVDSATAISFTRPANIRRALAVIGERAAPGATIGTFTIRPDRIDVTTINPDGRSQTGQVGLDYSLELRDFSTSDYDGLELSEIDPEAPAKIIDLAERREGLLPGDFDYMTISAYPTDLVESSWSAFWSEPPRGNDIAAAIDGSDVRPLGTPDAAARKAQAKASAAAERARRAAAKQAELAIEQAKCAVKATDGVALARCYR